MKNNQTKIKDKKEFAIKLVNISKRYTIHHEKPTLVEHLIHGRTEEFWALKNINLEINKGERVGIIGPNGSGKTTLLKIISGIATQTKGEILTEGKIVSLIDLEAGFHPELTGEQNILINGMLLGMKKSEVRQKLESIMEFADIGKFIDAPLFTYSTGMKLRLGFSVAVHADPSILVLDENIVAGDALFQQKSRQKIKSFTQAGKTIIVVSQWLNYIKQNCSRIILLKNGRIVGDGGLKVINKYV